MRKAVICLMCLPMLFLQSCEKPVYQVQQVDRGFFRVYVRWQIYQNEAMRNVDVCVAKVDSTAVPDNDSQCFFHGFDFSDVSARWITDQRIEVTMSCGYLDHFANNANVDDGTSDHVPDSFHIILRDTCERD